MTGLALRQQLPQHLVAVQDIDVDLELAPRAAPGFVRRPDLIVVHRDARLRVRREGCVVRASEVLVVVELVSPGSRRLDHVTKRGEYADAGIPHYWIVELGEPVTLLACHLAGEFGYADSGVVTGTFRTTEPFAFELRLDDIR
ncbi:MAG: Uma2 family endonuclease [Pseudonocardia sp.]